MNTIRSIAATKAQTSLNITDSCTRAMQRIHGSHLWKSRWKHDENSRPTEKEEDSKRTERWQSGTICARGKVKNWHFVGHFQEETWTRMSTARPIERVRPGEKRKILSLCSTFYSSVNKQLSLNPFEQPSRVSAYFHFFRAAFFHIPPWLWISQRFHPFVVPGPMRHENFERFPKIVGLYEPT